MDRSPSSPIFNFCRESPGRYLGLRHGLLVAQKTADSGASQVSWVRSERSRDWIGPKSGYLRQYFFVSRTARFVASDTTDPTSQNTDIWTYDLQTQSAKRLTFDPSIDSMPIWSPDGRQIIFGSNRGLRFDLYLKDATGAQEEKLIPQDGPDRFPTTGRMTASMCSTSEARIYGFWRFPSFKPASFSKRASTLRTADFRPMASGWRTPRMRMDDGRFT